MEFHNEFFLKKSIVIVSMFFWKILITIRGDWYRIVPSCGIFFCMIDISIWA